MKYKNTTNAAVTIVIVKFMGQNPDQYIIIPSQATLIRLTNILVNSRIHYAIFLFFGDPCSIISNSLSLIPYAAFSQK